MAQSRQNFRIADLGDIPTDLEQRFHRNGLYLAQALVDEGVYGCRQIGIADQDILILSEMLSKNGFSRLT